MPTIETLGEITDDYMHIPVILTTDGSVHRRMLPPNTDVSGESQQIQDKAAEVWTQEIIDAYTAHINPTPTLAEAKVLRIAVMQSAYYSAVMAGFTTNSILMQADLGRIERLKSAYDLAILESEATMDIISLDNTISSAVAVATVLTMIRALGVNARTLLFQFHARRNSINAISVPDTHATEDLAVAAVNAITWS